MDAIMSGMQEVLERLGQRPIEARSDEKPSNPKDLIGTNKVPLSLVPPTALVYAALGHLEGHLKYGKTNWREAGVKWSIYMDACLRHLAKVDNGEWCDPQTHVPHLGNALACINILIDAYESGKLIDDRPKEAPVADVIDRESSTVAHLRSLFGDRTPRHYTHGAECDCVEKREAAARHSR